MADEPTTRSIVRDGIAVGVATGAYGISFGAVSVASGLSVWQSCALSLLVFTGASQFALVGVIGTGGTPLFARGVGTAAGHPQHALRTQGRPAASAGAARSAWRPRISSSTSRPR